MVRELAVIAGLIEQLPLDCHPKLLYHMVEHFTFMVKCLNEGSSWVACEGKATVDRSILAAKNPDVSFAAICCCDRGVES